MLQDFFEEHLSRLQKSYPGISLKRLKEDYKTYLNKKYHTLESNADRLYDDYFFDSLIEGKPLEQIINQAHFYGYNFYVNENVLIPRSETELLVEEALLQLKNIKSPKVCDIGTGSGCILLTIALEVNKKIEGLGIDISSEALNIAKINYFQKQYMIKNGSKLNFIKNDRLNKIEKKFDLIVSNPPYIKASNDRRLVHDQVHKFEPKIALYLNDQEYDSWFKDFFKMIYNNLEPSGQTIMEGHENHLKEISEIAAFIGFKDIKIKKDLTNRDRFLLAKK